MVNGDTFSLKVPEDSSKKFVATLRGQFLTRGKVRRMVFWLFGGLGCLYGRRRRREGVAAQLALNSSASSRTNELWHHETWEGPIGQQATGENLRPKGSLKLGTCSPGRGPMLCTLPETWQEQEQLSMPTTESSVKRTPEDNLEVTHF